MTTRLALLSALLTATVASAQAPTAQPITPARDVAPTAPKLSEPLELKRQNVVLRHNLLQSRIEALKLSIEKEERELSASSLALKDEIEKAHPGWTLGSSGQIEAMPKPAEAKK